MTHEEIKILISAYIDGEVNPSEKNIVEEHLKECTSCQKDYKMYKAMSSSLSKWSDEALSPDEEIKVQRSFEQRREPMFTTRTMMSLGTTLALTIIIGSVVQQYVKNGVHGRLKAATADIGDQYSNGNSYQVRSSRAMAISGFSSNARQYQPYYMHNGLALANTGLLQAPAAPQAAAMYDASSALTQKAVKNDRKIIKNADITLKVQSAEKTQAELEGLVTKFNGIIINFQINKSEDGSRRGFLVFNVLPKNLPNLLPELRKLGEVQSENQSGVDITNQYEYLQSRLGNYQTEKDRLQKVLTKNPNDPVVNLDIQNELAGVEGNINALENGIKQLDDQTYMATVTVNFYDVYQMTPKVVTFKDKFITTFRDNFRTTIEASYELAINSFNGIIIVLSFLFQVAIWALLFWGVYLIVSRIFKK